MKHQSTLRVLAATSLVAVAVVLQSSSPASQGRPDASAQTVVIDGHDAVPGEVLVRYADTVSASSRQSAAVSVDAEQDVPVGGRGLRRIRSRSLPVEAMLAMLRGRPDVAYAEPNYIIRAVETPNDPQLPNLWGLLNTGQMIAGFPGAPGADIDATTAWNVTTGSRSSVVAVVDSGVDYTHPDLAANMWSAPSAYTVTLGGIAINCAAGTHGFNAITRTCLPADDNGHGTHVAGTIGAVGNNGIGVVGVNWTASIMGIKFLNSLGNGTTANAIDAIEFALQARAAFAMTSGANVRVMNASWGGTGASIALSDEIERANTQGVLFVAAAGNAGSNNEFTPFYPASYPSTNIISVAATDNTDHLASFSNFGPVSVDLAAPGVDILSTAIGGGYQFLSGTSMATPMVSGAAALVLSVCNQNTDTLRTTLLSSVDALGSLAGWVATSGRLNVNTAVRSCSGGAVTPPAAPTALKAKAGNAQVVLTWTGSAAADSYVVKRSVVKAGPYSIVASGVTAATYTDTTVTNGIKYFYMVSAHNDAGDSGNSNKVNATPVPPPAAPTGLTAATGALTGEVALSWNASTFAASYRIKRSTTSGGPYTNVAKISKTTYVDKNRVSGKRYFYVVTAINTSGESGDSAQASAIAR